MDIKKLSIVMPVSEEKKTIHFILDKIKDIELNHEIEKEVVIVDDCSTNTTEKIIKQYRKLNKGLNINYYKNKSKATEINTVTKKTTGEYLIIQDDDAKYNNVLFKSVQEGFADNVVNSSRFISENLHRMLFFLAYNRK